jgi:DNA-binding NarL/FixJ family response regulator
MSESYHHGEFRRINVSTTKTILVVAKGRLFRDAIQAILKAPERTIINIFENLADIPSDIFQTYPAPHLFVTTASNSEELAALAVEIKRLRDAAPTAVWLLLSPRSDSAFIQQARACDLDWLLPEDAPAEVLELLTVLILHGPCSGPTPLKLPVSERTLTQRPTVAIGGMAQPAIDDTAARSSVVELSAIRRVEDSMSRVSAADIREQPSDGASRQTGQADLSDRENQILGCLVSGMPNKLIARKLNIAEATVKVHIKGLLRKLRVSNRTQAAILALNILTKDALAEIASNE